MFLWSKMTCMKSFEKQMRSFFQTAPHTLYDVSLSVGLDPSNTTKILYGKRPTTFDKRVEIITLISKSPLLELPIEVMLRWLAEEYLPSDVLADSIKDKYPERFKALESQIETKVRQLKRH